MVVRIEVGTFRVQKEMGQISLYFPKTGHVFCGEMSFKEQHLQTNKLFLVISFYLPFCLPKAFSSSHPLLPPTRRQEHRT